MLFELDAKEVFIALTAEEQAAEDEARLGSLEAREMIRAARERGIQPMTGYWGPRPGQLAYIFKGEMHATACLCGECAKAERWGGRLAEVVYGGHANKCRTCEYQFSLTVWNPTK